MEKNDNKKKRGNEVEQVKENGHIEYDYDIKLSPTKIFELLKKIFKTDIKKDNKQYIVYEKIALLCANVTYLGNPHPYYKKRIQLQKYFENYTIQNKEKGLKTFFLGIYSRKKSHLFVIFDAETYIEHKLNSSSAHLQTSDLQHAKREGSFFKVDNRGNNIHVFKEQHFIGYLKSLCKIPTFYKFFDYEDIMNKIFNYCTNFFKSINYEWIGIECYKEMDKDKYRQRKQNRWRGRYFEYLFEKYLAKNEFNGIKKFAEKTKGGIDLDLIFPELENCYGDLKCDTIGEDIMGNKFESFYKVFEKDGTVYYICALGVGEKDSDHDYAVSKYWNNYIRDENKRDPDDYLIEHTGPRMKYSMNIKRFKILRINKDIYDILTKDPLKQGKNSNGKPRNAKAKIKSNLISDLTIFDYEV